MICFGNACVGVTGVLFNRLIHVTISQNDIVSAQNMYLSSSAFTVIMSCRGGSVVVKMQ